MPQDVAMHTDEVPAPSLAPHASALKRATRFLSLKTSAASVTAVALGAGVAWGVSGLGLGASGANAAPSRARVGQAPRPQPSTAHSSHRVAPMPVFSADQLEHEQPAQTQVVSRAKLRDIAAERARQLEAFGVPELAERQLRGVAQSGADVPSARLLASFLSRRARWVEAASAWREVLRRLHLRKTGHKETQAHGLEVRQAETELREAQSHLTAFYSVGNLVSPGVDSRNPLANSGRWPEPEVRIVAARARMQAGQGKAGEQRVVAVAALRPTSSIVTRSAKAAVPGATTSGASKLAGRTLVTISATPVARKSSAAPARKVLGPSSSRALRRSAAGQAGRNLEALSLGVSSYALAWWARPMVEVGADSSNPVVGVAPISTPVPVGATNEAAKGELLADIRAPEHQSLSPLPLQQPLLAAPRPSAVQTLAQSRIAPHARVAFAVAPASPGSPVLGVMPDGAQLKPRSPLAAVNVSREVGRAPTAQGRSWTMQVRLPGAAEAALAAEARISY
jgi:hypothetical protein